jgi:hypothetical protein
MKGSRRRRDNGGEGVGGGIILRGVGDEFWES